MKLSEKKEKELYFRFELSKICMERKFSVDTRHEIMVLIGSLSTGEEKEKASEMALKPLEKAETEKQAIEAVRQITANFK